MSGYLFEVNKQTYMEILNEALGLLVVGMVMVFIILWLVVVTGNLVISLTNRFIPEDKKPGEEGQGGKRIHHKRLAAIVASVAVITHGKGTIDSIRKNKSKNMTYMAKEIKFSLLYRDMWQSSGKYVPTVEQLTEVAPAIIDMGCFARVETNGGGFEQINLLFGENPNKSVREWTQPFNDAGIQTHMLERGLNGIRMSPVPADVRRLMFQVKKKQGTDIARSFDGLNDPRNLKNSILFAKEAGMISQAALSLTVSPIHTVEYYIELADTLIETGADEICIKDMAGVGRPASIGRIIKSIKQKYPAIPVTYHGHAGPGFQMASILEAAYAGAEYIDVGMEPLSWGTGHADLLAVQSMLKDAGFSVPDINMKAYMKVRSLTQKFMDDFLGYYIDPKNRVMNSLLIGPGLPGGMMGSLMADLENNLTSLNKWKVKNGQSELTQDDLLIKLFDEVTYVWPKVGYPPLVTPYSQYVKNLALMNVLQLEKGEETLDDDCRQYMGYDPGQCR